MRQTKSRSRRLRRLPLRLLAVTVVVLLTLGCIRTIYSHEVKGVAVMLGWHTPNDKSTTRTSSQPGVQSVVPTSVSPLLYLLIPSVS